MTEAMKPIIGTSADDLLQGGRGHEVLSGRGGDDTIYSNNGHDLAYGGAGDDLIYGQSGNDVLWGSGGPSYVDLTNFTIAEDYQGQVIFNSESAGYRNSLGSYKVDGDGNIYDVQFHFLNASLQGSGGDLIGGVSSSPLELQAGDQLGFFIVANGYSYNNAYTNLDMENGELQMRNQDGSNASISSNNPSLWLVGEDGTETQIVHHIYHTAAGVENDDYALNPDGIAHTVGMLDTDEGTIKLGFEDLYNGGDRDFDDSVFTIDIGQSNATVLDPNVSSGEGGDDTEGLYTWEYDEDGNLVKYDQDGNFVAYSSQNDEIYGGRGNDEIHGRAGHDKLYGGDGVDEIFGGTGNDHIEGGTGNDTVEAGKGDDVVKGDSGHDKLYGQTGADNIDGGSGNDHIEGGADNDIVDGGSGNDHLDGGTGDDQLTGGYGNDQLFGQSGDDILYGDNGNDQLEGGADNDTLYGGQGQDKLTGGSGDDSLYGDDGNDVINAGSGDDILEGGDNHDTLNAGIGDDVLRGGSGNDKLYGSSGDDLLISGSGRDVVDGGSGIDTASYADASAGVNIDIHRKKVTGGDSDTLKSIENVIGSAHDDTVRGNRLDNVIEGGAGDDLLRGMTGSDTLSGDAGSDTFFWKQSDIGSDLDTILDFALDEDILSFDLSSSLAALDTESWLEFETVGENTILYADFDADGDFSDSVAFAELNDINLSALTDVQIAVA